MSSFLLQGAADPEHPNKHPGTPHPTSVDLHNFEETGWRKIGRAAACRGQKNYEIKMTLFVHEIFHPFGESRRRKPENIQSKVLNIFKKYLKLFSHRTQIQSVAHSEHSNKFYAHGFTQNPMRIWHCWLT